MSHISFGGSANRGENSNSCSLQHHLSFNTNTEEGGGDKNQGEIREFTSSKLDSNMGKELWQY